MTLSRRLVSTGTAACLAGGLLLIPGAMSASAAPSAAAKSVAAAAQPAATSVPVTGTLNGLPFTGALSGLSTSVVNGVLTLTGTLTGTGLPGTGLNFAVPLALPAQPAACSILALNLGPLHLNLLGLVIDLNQVVLNITAQPGPGQLLGNLLCAVAHLLDNNGPLTGISALLNRLLAGLGLA